MVMLVASGRREKYGRARLNVAGGHRREIVVGTAGAEIRADRAIVRDPTYPTDTTLSLPTSFFEDHIELARPHRLEVQITPAIAPGGLVALAGSGAGNPSIETASGRRLTDRG
jgi:hypothetical protein